ncbi:MAG: hypothetical protein WBA61_15475 [Aequorivita sp.]
MAQKNSSEEIDLGYIFKKSNDFFKSIIRSLFQIFDFLKKYFIIIIVLLIVGFGYGYYKDSNNIPIYNNEVIIIPNFGSVDYLYEKVAAINNKTNAGDTVYLKKILDSNFQKLKRIELEPLVDIYNFASKPGRNFDVLRLFVEKQDISRYMEDFSISKYYKYHSLKIYVYGTESSEKIITDLLLYLNENEHLKEYQKVFVENKKFEIQENYNMISQIDSVLMANSKINATVPNVSITNSSDLFNLIDRKRQLVENLLQLKTEEIDFEAPIKKVSVDYNLEPKKFLTISNKVKYPLLLVFLFSMVFFILYLFRNMRSYADTQK